MGPRDVIEAALALAGERPWRDVTLSDIAERSGTDLARLRAAYPSKQAILAAFADRMDAAMLGGIDAEAGAEPVHDRLVDTLLRRIEALAPHKRAIGSIARDTVAIPDAALCAGARLLRSMAWALEASGAVPQGLFGRLRVKALAAIYLSTLCVWLRDDDPELLRTMAHLDRRLRQAGRLEGLIGRLPRGVRPQEADQGAAS